MIIISHFSYGLFAGEDRGWELKRIEDGGSMGEYGKGWEVGVLKEWSERNSGNKQHCLKYFTFKKAIKQRKPRKKREELGMQGTGGGRFAPLLFPPNFVS